MQRNVSSAPLQTPEIFDFIAIDKRNRDWIINLPTGKLQPILVLLSATSMKNRSERVLWISILLRLRLSLSPLIRKNPVPRDYGGVLCMKRASIIFTQFSVTILSLPNGRPVFYFILWF